VLALVALIVIVDVAFVAAYFLAGVRSAPAAGKLAFTVLWTVVVLLVVIRGLSRVRATRLHRAEPRKG
jgi:hypothetical protein